MLRVRFQTAPLSGEGARLRGGRWNRIGQTALYLSGKHTTAIAEYHQGISSPGTLVAYDVKTDRIVDLASKSQDELSIAELDRAMQEPWRLLVDRGMTPASWLIVDRLIAQDMDGILVPSARSSDALNLVLWRWSEDGSDGARVRAVDPYGDLRAS